MKPISWTVVVPVLREHCNSQIRAHMLRNTFEFRPLPRCRWRRQCVCCFFNGRACSAASPARAGRPTQRRCRRCCCRCCRCRAPRRVAQCRPARRRRGTCANLCSNGASPAESAENPPSAGRRRRRLRRRLCTRPARPGCVVVYAYHQLPAQPLCAPAPAPRAPRPAPTAPRAPRSNPL